MSTSMRAILLGAALSALAVAAMSFRYDLETSDGATPAAYVMDRFTGKVTVRCLGQVCK